MTTHDTINACFEGGGALFLCMNVRRLLKDKSVKGVSLVPSLWWTAWGFWNIYFYAAVACAASFWAGIAVVSVQAVWVCLALMFARRDRRLNGALSTTPGLDAFEKLGADMRRQAGL
jgi:uncharacterized membrane protein YqgA involved in biofilm formation